MNVNILDIPVYYISFKKNKSTESHLKQKGFTNINHFKAIDGRKFDINKLLKDNLITSSAYYDLLNKRCSVKGLSSKGAVGCTFSHLRLWAKCIEKRLPYIIIAEEDVIIKHLNDSDISNIKHTLSKPNSFFVGAELKEKGKNLYFFGLQFCVISFYACKKLVEKALPMDIQTDAYISLLNVNDDITVEGYALSTQSKHISSIQDICFKCFLPDSQWFYYAVIAIIVILLIISIIFIVNFKKCQKKLK
jgi:GR25 family glycosyltransferase involved in LPS biosynthesis